MDASLYWPDGTPRSNSLQFDSLEINKVDGDDVFMMPVNREGRADTGNAFLNGELQTWIDECRDIVENNTVLKAAYAELTNESVIFKQIAVTMMVVTGVTQSRYREVPNKNRTGRVYYPLSSALRDHTKGALVVLERGNAFRGTVRGAMQNPLLMMVSVFWASRHNIAVDAGEGCEYFLFHYPLGAFMKSVLHGNTHPKVITDDVPGITSSLSSQPNKKRKASNDEKE